MAKLVHILVLALLLFPQGTHGQWSYIPVDLPSSTQLPTYWEKGTGLMFDNGSGFWSQSMYYSPGSGTDYRAHFTDDDWVSTAVAFGGGGGMGCCSMDIAEYTEGRGVHYIVNYQGSRSVHTAVYEDGGFTHHQLHWIPGFLSMLEPISDTVCVVISSVFADKLISRITPNTISTDTIDLTGWVTDLSFKGADTGACVVSWGDVGGSVWVTSNGGGDWEQVLVDSLHTIHDVEWLGPHTLWLVGSGGLVKRSVNGGANWESVAFPDTVDLHCVSGYTSDSVWVGGEGGTVQATGDGGIVWDDLSVEDSLIYRLQTFDGAVYAYQQNRGQYGIKYTRLYKYELKGLMHGSNPIPWYLTSDGISIPWLQPGPATSLRVTDRIGREVSASHAAPIVRMEHLTTGVYMVYWETDGAHGVLKVLWVHPE